jgi:GT2 family glycosyltransferase
MKTNKLFTAVIPCIRADLLPRCLETLYKYTDNIFYCFVIDQSIDGVDMNLRDKYPNLMIIRSPKTDIHYTGNLGFTQATNLGMRLADTPYVIFLNDDVEFIHPGWWEGVMETFRKVEDATPDRPALLVNCASIKLPDWSVGRPRGEDHYILPYKEEYTNEDWDILVSEEHYVNEHLTIKPGSVIDGINLYCSVADTNRLIEVGMLDELWFPGGADDYDLCCRASMFGYRCVGTTLSWVFHHWSKSFGSIQDEVKSLAMPELNHGDLREKWGERFDLWGVRCDEKECEEILRTNNGMTAKCPKHSDNTYSMPQNIVMPL